MPACSTGPTSRYFHQVGPDQEGFVDFWKSSLRDEVLS